MELVTEPDTYTPSIDIDGNYIDVVPSINILKKGIYCNCGCKSNKLYNTYSSFSTHVKTKTHKQWLSQLNLNKTNFFVEVEKLKKTVDTQRKIIAGLEIEIKNKSLTIDYLTQQLIKPSEHSEINLIDI